jgi:hypothetical protein
VLVSGQQRILDCILRVGGIAEVSKSASAKTRPETQQSIVYFPPQFVAGTAISYECAVDYRCRRSHDFYSRLPRLLGNVPVRIPLPAHCMRVSKLDGRSAGPLFLMI